MEFGKSATNFHSPHAELGLFSGVEIHMDMDMEWKWMEMGYNL